MITTPIGELLWVVDLDEARAEGSVHLPSGDAIVLVGAGSTGIWGVLVQGAGLHIERQGQVNDLEQAMEVAEMEAGVLVEELRRG